MEEKETPAEEIPEGLDEYFEPLIYSVQKGKYATVEGIFSNSGAYSIEMKNCKILATE